MLSYHQLSQEDRVEKEGTENEEWSGPVEEIVHEKNFNRS